MKAIIRHKGGVQLSNMQVAEVPLPTPEDHEVKIQMSSSRINPVDMDLMKGMPFLSYKKPQIGGIDGAGTIVELGENVTDFAVGDAVFFYRKFNDIGSWGEFITVPATDVAPVPSNIQLEGAGAIALPLLTAYEALSRLAPKQGETILIHGAGGGVGFQAVQLAKQMGLKVIANAGPSDQSWLERVKVNQFINYKEQDFAEVLSDEHIDYVFDVIGKEVLMKSIQLHPKKVISTSFPDVNSLGKTGMKMPGLLKWVMKMATRKFPSSAKSAGVELIGQVTGPNGALMREASQLVEQIEYVIKSYQTIPLSQIEKNGMEGSKVGSVILLGSN